MVLVVSILLPLAAVAKDGGPYGPFGPEGPRLREQLWILPSGTPGEGMRATVFRPADDDVTIRRPLVVINHGTSEETRLAVSMPVYYWLSRWFVERGYVVVLPQRRGHGATGGPLVESIGNCADPDHYHSGLAAADDIEAALGYMRRQSFVDADDMLVVGISTGGWGSLALASRNPPGVRAVINIAGGRGALAFGRRGDVCDAERLVEAAGAYGHSARIPTVWLYARNDSYFSPDLARTMAASWQEAGGLAELHVLPPYGSDGHGIADDRAGWDIWGPVVDAFLLGHETAPAAEAASNLAPAPPEGIVSSASLKAGETVPVPAP